MLQISAADVQFLRRSSSLSEEEGGSGREVNNRGRKIKLAPLKGPVPHGESVWECMPACVLCACVCVRVLGPYEVNRGRKIKLAPLNGLVPLGECGGVLVCVCV